MTKFCIPTNRIYVIAEIANAHSGSIKKLKSLVEKTVKTVTDAIKFQFHKVDELLVPNHPEYKLFKKLEIPDSEWKKVFTFLKKNNVKIFTDVFSVKRAKFANNLGCNAFKIHSSDTNNIDLLEYVVSTKKPILLSCAGSKLNEIDNAINLIKKTSNSQIILMHSFQAFPTKISQINLHRITSLRQRYHLPVGYMDHIDGNSELALYLPLLAIGLGSNIIEKHITLNRNLKEIDYQSSLNPDEFSRMIKILKKSFKSLGTGSFRFTPDELQYRKRFKKILVADKNLKKNYLIKKSDVTLKRVYNESPKNSHLIVGSLTKTEIKKNTPLDENVVQFKK